MELGSEYDLDFSRLTDTADTVFTYLKEFHTIYTDSGRSALRLLSGRLRGAAVLLPDYLCETVPDALPKDCRIVRYPTGRRFQIDMETLEHLLKTHRAGFLYLMHYFGTLQPAGCLRRIAELREQYRLTVIEDTTHSLFSAPITVGDYGIASLRKWFPVPDGGVLYARDRQLLPPKPKRKKNVSRKLTAMLLKHLYLTGHPGRPADYREIFIQEEHALDCQTAVYEMSDMTRFLLSHNSVEHMCTQRRKNTGQLLEALQDLTIPAAIDIQPSDVLLALPVCLADRDRLRKRLTERRIYCAVHWPLGHPAAFTDTQWIERHILSLPIDQRYREKEIAYLSECLKGLL